MKIKKQKWNVAKVIFIAIACCCAWAFEQYKSNLPLDNNEVELVKCVDGDTARFLINGNEETVRFLAIDTPETVKPGTPVQPYGKEASDYTCNILTNASEIKLEYEEGNQTDKYGRGLAWIFADGELVQENLISEGYGKVAYLYGDYRYTSDLQRAETLAKENRLGIWSEEE